MFFEGINFFREFSGNFCHCYGHHRLLVRRSRLCTMSFIPTKVSRIPAYGSANSGHSYLHPAKHVMDRFEKKTSAQDQFAKLLLERRLSLRIGVLPESTTVGAIGTSLAGIHLIGTGNPFVVTGEVKNQRFITLGRYVLFLCFFT